MRIFIAGATGVLGIRVVPLLVAGGHDVWGMTRTPSKSDLLWKAGAEPVVCDVYDLTALRDEVVRSQPDAVLHLLTAARAAGATRFLAKSVAWQLEGDADRAVDDPRELCSM